MFPALLLSMYVTSTKTEYVHLFLRLSVHLLEKPLSQWSNESINDLV